MESREDGWASLPRHLQGRQKPTIKRNAPEHSTQGELLVARWGWGMGDGELEYFSCEWSPDGTPTAKAMVPKLGNGWEAKALAPAVSKPVLIYIPKFSMLLTTKPHTHN